jgi:hypothetical protein
VWVSCFGVPGSGFGVPGLEFGPCVASVCAVLALSTSASVRAVLPCGAGAGFQGSLCRHRHRHRRGLSVPIAALPTRAPGSGPHRPLCRPGTWQEYPALFGPPRAPERCPARRGPRGVPGAAPAISTAPGGTAPAVPTAPGASSSRPCLDRNRTGVGVPGTDGGNPRHRSAHYGPEVSPAPARPAAHTRRQPRHRASRTPGTDPAPARLCPTTAPRGSPDPFPAHYGTEGVPDPEPFITAPRTAYDTEPLPTGRAASLNTERPPRGRARVRALPRRTTAPVGSPSTASPRGKSRTVPTPGGRPRGVSTRAAPRRHWTASPALKPRAPGQA